MSQQPATPPPPPPPPYQAPATGSIEDVADGQRLIIYGILVYLISIVLSGAVDVFVGGAVALGAAILAIMGLLKLSEGMGWSAGVKVVLIICTFIPLVVLVMLLIVNGRATERLKAAGYKVGLMGARKP